MIHSLRLGAFALLLAAAPALAQTPVFEVRDAAGATLHFAVNDDGTVTCTDCISGAEIADGTVTSADIAVPFYYDKSQLYERTSTDVFVGTFGEVEASCDDANDLPLSGSCPVGTGTDDATVMGFSSRNWTSATQPAGVICRARQEASNATDTVRARIVCLAVPGTGTPTLAPDLAAPSPEQ